MIWTNMYKRRYVPVYRDFPKGCGPCGVFTGDISTSGESLMQSKFKEGIVLRAHGDFSDIKKTSPNHSETEGFRLKDLDDDLRDVSTKDESILASYNGGVEDPQEEEDIGESVSKQNETSSVKKRRFSLHNSTMEVETDVVNTSKRVLVSGLAADSKSPWRQPKNQSARQVNSFNGSWTNDVNHFICRRREGENSEN